MPLEERLAAKIVVDDAGCWLWCGAATRNGYGQVRVGDRARLVHRVVYELLVGPIPDGCELDHLCRVRRCCNPGHVEAVDHRTNVLRGDGLSARFARRDECANGHSFTEENTRQRPGHGRDCRQCGRDRKQRFLKAHRHAA